MNRLIIITRYFLPVDNGLSHHSAFLSRLLRDHYDEVVVICEHDALRNKQPQSGENKLMEYSSVRDLFTKLAGIVATTGESNTVLLQYVPHMWGRGGVALRVSLLPYWLRLSCRTPTVSFLHELSYDWSLNPKYLLLGIVHRIQLFFIENASDKIIVTNNNRYETQSRKRLLRRRRNIFQVPVGCVSGRTNPPRSLPCADIPYVTWFGTMSVDQKLEELIQAFGDVSNQCATLNLKIVGTVDRQSHRMQAIHQYIQDMGLEDKVIIRGFVDEHELTATLSRSLANFHMASSGPSGRRTVVAAYVRSGRPLIAIRGSESDPEFIDRRNVYFVEPNRRSIAKAIIDIWSDAHLRNELSMGSRALYESVYSDNVILQRLLVALSLTTRGIESGQ